MKRRSAPVDDLHQELLSWLDDTDGRPGTRTLRIAVNAVYRAHCCVLVCLIHLIAKRSIHGGLA